MSVTVGELFCDPAGTAGAAAGADSVRDPETAGSAGGAAMGAGSLDGPPAGSSDPGPGGDGPRSGVIVTPGAAGAGVGSAGGGAAGVVGGGGVPELRARLDRDRL